MARELTQEQIEQRRKNQQESEQSSGGLGDGAILDSWKPDDGKVNSIDVIVHTGTVIHELHRHAHKEVITVNSKNKPPYRMLVTRYVRCNESEGWHRYMRMKKEQPEPPKCMFERLIQYLAARIDRDPSFKDEIVFRFGEGCVDKEQKATPVEEFTAGDICNLTGGKHGWKKSMAATQRRLMVVVPWRTSDGAKVFDDASPKIALESWKLIDGFIKEKGRAMGRFGDEADPTIKPAVYRFTADRTNPKSFGPEFTVSFLNEVKPDDLPDSVQEAWANDLPEDLRTEIKGMLAPNSPSQVLRHLQDALVADVDLEKVCGYAVGPAPASRGAREERSSYGEESRPASPPARAAAPAGGGRRLPSSAQPVGEPCFNCGTPWPPGERYCPGKLGPKRCPAEDEDVPVAGDVTDAPSDEIPF